MKTETMIKRMRGAADLIEKKGWCQNEYENYDGEVCILGALRRVFPIWNDETYYESLVLIEIQLEKSLPDAQGTLAEWNDEPDRTKDQVVSLLRDTANHLETP